MSAQGCPGAVYEKGGGQRPLQQHGVLNHRLKGIEIERTISVDEKDEPEVRLGFEQCPDCIEVETLQLLGINQGCSEAALPQRLRQLRFLQRPPGDAMLVEDADDVFRLRRSGQMAMAPLGQARF